MPSSRRYPTRPLVGLGVAVLRPGAVLLVRRGAPPAQGAWSLPGGLQELGETAEEGARRELREETGLEVGPLELVGHVDSIHRDARGRILYHYTILDFAARWQGDLPRPGSDVTDLAWAAFDQFDAFALWEEARRIIGRARAALQL
jgi:8-oxo-dGTP diphosphatase